MQTATKSQQQQQQQQQQQYSTMLRGREYDSANGDVVTSSSVVSTSSNLSRASSAPPHLHDDDLVGGVSFTASSDLVGAEDYIPTSATGSRAFAKRGSDGSTSSNGSSASSGTNGAGSTGNGRLPGGSTSASATPNSSSPWAIWNNSSGIDTVKSVEVVSSSWEEKSTCVCVIAEQPVLKVPFGLGDVLERTVSLDNAAGSRLLGRWTDSSRPPVVMPPLRKMQDDFTASAAHAGSPMYAFGLQNDSHLDAFVTNNGTGMMRTLSSPAVTNANRSSDDGSAGGVIATPATISRSASSDHHKDAVAKSSTFSMNASVRFLDVLLSLNNVDSPTRATRPRA